jgi:hypothetical protein
MEGMSPGRRSEGSAEHLRGGERDWAGWRRIGLGQEGDELQEEPLSEGELFRNVGDLGLECLVSRT